MNLLVLFSLFVVSVSAFANPIVAYVTDLEGSRKRLERFMAQSEAFELGNDGKFHLKPDAHFVFGGDAPDRYLGSRWVIEQLVRLKEETPERVALILGNRDINKMRLTSELSATALTKSPVRFHFTNEEEWKKHNLSEPASERLKYIFSNTMGAPKGFELRRKELAIDLMVNESAISDRDVTASFLSELGPFGKFRRFLELGQLAHRIGNTLFLHGGVTEENLEMVPGDAKRRDSVDAWIRDLNHWMRAGVEIWKEHGSSWDGESARPEQPWLDYPMSIPALKTKLKSVVIGRNADVRNNPHLPPAKVISKLHMQGVERIVVGHTPTGDYSLILRTQDDRFEVVSADNSYSNETFASLVHFKGDGLRRTVISGLLSLAGGVETAITDILLGEPTPIGKRLNGGVLFGYREKNPKELISFRYGDKFLIITEVIPEESIDRARLLAPSAGCEAMLTGDSLVGIEGSKF